MSIFQIVENVEKAAKTVELKNQGFFLSSCFIMVSSFGDIDSMAWQIHYFDPKTRNIAVFLVDNERTEFKEMSTPTQEIEIRPLQIKNVILSGNEALKIVEKEVGEQKDSVGKILITLHTSGNIKDSYEELWTINVITKALKVTSFNISAKSGELLSKIQESLLG